MSLRNFQQTVRDAVKYFSMAGYVSERAVDDWSRRIGQSAQEALLSPQEASTLIARHLSTVYDRVLRRIPAHLAKLQKSFAGRVTPEMYFRRVASYPELATKMRKQLDQRIAASTDLIKIRREESINATLRRFKGWATSVPAGGTPTPRRSETELLLKDFRRVRFETNRLNLDQGHKLNSALNATFAEGTGAIAAIWHSNWRQTNYNFRHSHKERDGHIYAVRDNWALGKGLMKPGPDGYTDQITAPAEEVNCRCYFEYIYNLDSLPAQMLTAKGRKAMAALDELDMQEVA